MKKQKKQKPLPITSKELFEKMFLESENITIPEVMIEFAKIKVLEALFETSKHFKNPENVSHVLNHYKLDKII